MRKLLVSLAAAGTMLAVASPASAQWHRPGYGYNNSPRAHFEQEVRQLRYDRDNLARSGRLTGREARDLDLDIQALQNSVWQASRGGISPRQADALSWRVNRVRNEIQRYSDYDNNGRGWHNGRRY
jgi:hypothetical protein